MHSNFGGKIEKGVNRYSFEKFEFTKERWSSMYFIQTVNKKGKIRITASEKFSE